MALSSWSLDWPAEATEGKRSMVKSFGAIFSLDGTQLAEVQERAELALGGVNWIARLVGQDILELTATRSSDDRVAAHKLRVAELAKELDLRQKEVDALAGDIQAQMKIAEEGGEAADGAGAELARLLALKGQFSKRIAELKNQQEVDVSVTAHEVTTVVKLPAGSFRQFPGASKPLCWCPQVVAEQSTREITKTIKVPMETAESTPLRTLVLSLNGEQKFFTYDFPRGYAFSLTSPLSVKAVVCRFDQAPNGTAVIVRRDSEVAKGSSFTVSKTDRPGWFVSTFSPSFKLLDGDTIFFQLFNAGSLKYSYVEGNNHARSVGAPQVHVTSKIFRGKTGDNRFSVAMELELES